MVRLSPLGPRPLIQVRPFPLSRAEQPGGAQGGGAAAVEETERVYKEIDAKHPTHQWVVINTDALRRVVSQELFGAEAGDRTVPRKARERVEEIRQSRP
jgi:hypothetical protein